MSEVTCVDESVYRGALTWGRRYILLAQDEEKGKISVQGDNGRTRWYPALCFDQEGRDVVRIESIKIDDYYEGAPQSSVDVEVTLSDGELRWCFFVTPEGLSGFNQAQLGGGRLLLAGAPHAIIVDAIRRETIEQTLHHLERHNELRACTLPIRGRETDLE